MKVYIVETSYDYEGSDVLSCFSTLEEAKRYAYKHAMGHMTTVSEWDIDKWNEPLAKSASTILYKLVLVDFRTDRYEEN